MGWGLLPLSRLEGVWLLGFQSYSSGYWLCDLGQAALTSQCLSFLICR